MKKYLVLYQSGASAAAQMASATPEQMQAGMQAWMAWAKKAGSGLVDLGQPLRYVGTTTASGASIAVLEFMPIPGM